MLKKLARYSKEMEEVEEAFPSPLAGKKDSTRQILKR